MTRLLDADAVSTRLADAAAQNDNVLSLERLDDDSWGLQFDSAHEGCLIEMDDAGATLTLSVDVGTPFPGREREVMAAALAYNALWRDTGGDRIVQAGEEDELILVRQVGADAVAAHEFDAALGAFGSLAAWWQAFVRHDGSGDADLADHAPAGLRV